MTQRVALYPGSFDPITNGHLDIIARARSIFDEIIVGVAANKEKKTMFSAQERVDLVRRVVADLDGVHVDAFEGLTVEYAMRKGVCALLRGLRAVADFEYELQMANMNRQLAKGLETVFVMTSEKSFFVSSRNVKEVAWFGGDISELVPPQVAEAVQRKVRELRG